MGCHGLWLIMEARKARLDFAEYYQNWGTQWRSAGFVGYIEVENFVTNVYVYRE
jgi:hypothetical protein